MKTKHKVINESSNEKSGFSADIKRDRVAGNKLHQKEITGAL